MQNFLYFGLAGLVGGVLGGMGMGGGTVLIPLLTIFLKTPQITAQIFNLITFVPMAIIALIVHKKNGLLKLKGLLYLIIPATLFAILGGCLSNAINGDILKRIFGGFLIALSVLQFFSQKLSKFAATNFKKKNKKI